MHSRNRVSFRSVIFAKDIKSRSEVLGKRKDPVVALALSLLFIGLGQIYLGKVWRGIGFLILGVTVAVLIGGSFGWPGVMTTVLVPLGSAFDAYKLAKLYNTNL
jgi:TM2 domain-containing membrane protein YozV